MFKPTYVFALLALFMVLQVPVVDAIELPNIGDDVDVKQRLEEKGGDVFDIIVYTVVIIGFICFAVAAGFFAAGQPDKGKMLAVSSSIGLVFVGLIGGGVKLFIG